MAFLLAVPAIILLGLTTRRQADTLFRPPMPARRRQRLRVAGWLLLAVSLVAVLAGGDTGRRLIEWICALGACGLATALAFTVLAERRKRRLRAGARSRRAPKSETATTVGSPRSLR